MAARPIPIHVDPDSELGHVLRDAASTREPVLVDTGGQILELDVHPALLDAEQTTSESDQINRTIIGIRSASGGWRDIVDARALTDYVYERRQIRSGPPVDL